ncbi:hypothetical protein MUJ63_06060 [Lachnospiraceae bacterium NSJ-143]|nr:hypothetical protein [Lachnospiraceae bacterium NSJ-143]
MRLKYKKAFFVFGLSFCVCVCGVFYGKQVRKDSAVFMPLNNRVIVVDAGHGGWAPYA